MKDVNKQHNQTVKRKNTMIDSSVRQMAQSLIGGKEAKFLAKSRNQNMIGNNSGGAAGTGTLGGKSYASNGALPATTSPGGGQQDGEVMLKIPHNTLNTALGLKLKSRNSAVG